MNAFFRYVRSQAPRAPLGTWFMSASPLVAEALGHAGFEWAVIDMEHTPLDMMDLIHMQQAMAGTRMLSVVRVPWNDTVQIKRVLDTGATTLMIPFVQTVEEARAAVAATRYPPEGVRGLAAMSRASRFGTHPDWARSANQYQGTIIQLETPEAVSRLEAIAALDGVDSLFFSPGDFSANMGLPGQAGHPDVMAAAADFARRVRASGKLCGTVGGTAAMVQQFRDMGFDFVAVASDLGLLMRACQGIVSELQPSGSATAAPRPSGGTY